MTINQNFSAPEFAHQARNPLVGFWNEIVAPKMIPFQHILVGGLSRHSAIALPKLGLVPGSRVLDVGCGFGDTAIDIAHRIAPGGEVVGIDCCQSFIDIAWACAEFSLAPNIHFTTGDAESDLQQNHFDFVFSRFGTMFFQNPVAGLRSIRRALKPGGRLAHIVWRRREDNPWLNEPHRKIRQFLPAPGEEARTCGPGPFSMASEPVTRAQMEAAGFVDIAFERIDTKVLIVAILPTRSPSNWRSVRRARHSARREALAKPDAARSKRRWASFSQVPRPPRTDCGWTVPPG